MKKFYTTLSIAIVFITQIQAQVPQGFNYQATVRNSSGDLIINTNVYFKFNLIQGSQTSVPVFTETHYVPTDDLGQVNLIIGEGTASSGVFSEIEWSLGSYYLGIELDTGSGYVAMGTTQLLSVPYALYAKNSGNTTTSSPNLEKVLTEGNNANNKQIKNLATPTEAKDAVTLEYLSSQLDSLRTVLLESINSIKLSIDNDNDGFTEEQGDCNDNDSTIHPAAFEIEGDGIDQNCDGYDEKTTYIPDDNFEQWLIDLGYDNNLDNYVPTKDIRDINRLWSDNYVIDDLTGIEDFVNLKELGIYWYTFKSIDLTKNTNLENLLLHGLENKLDSISINENIALKELSLYNNAITKIDVSKNVVLTKLDVTNNPNLNCIQVNETQKINIPSEWSKDNTASYSLDCSTSIYLDDNGVTIKARPWGEIGDTTTINGNIYKIVSEEELRDLIRNDEPFDAVCTSKITNMQGLFLNGQSYNWRIKSWDVSNVTNMTSMFYNSNYTDDLSYWNVENVTNMSEMFYKSQFNGDISSWNVSKVTNMRNMFASNSTENMNPFNKDISSWDTSSVTDMSSMFWYSEFNQPIGSWDVSSVVNMSSLFDKSNFNQDISNWDVSNVENMFALFAYTNFNQNLNSWNVSKVKNMHSMFERNTSFNKDISNWNTINVTNMTDMFKYASSFNQNLSEWCVSNIATEPNGFSENSPLTEQNKPLWGTCE